MVFMERGGRGNGGRYTQKKEFGVRDNLVRKKSETPLSECVCVCVVMPKRKGDLESGGKKEREKCSLDGAAHC